MAETFYEHNGRDVQRQELQPLKFRKFTGLEGRWRCGRKNAKRTVLIMEHLIARKLTSFTCLYGTWVLPHPGGYHETHQVRQAEDGKVSRGRQIHKLNVNES